MPILINELVLVASKKAVKEDRFAASTELHALAAAGNLFIPPPLVEADSDSEPVEVAVDDEGDFDPGDCVGTLHDDEDTQSHCPGGEPIDVTVTYDGTWSKRGFTALYGAGVVASWDTGRVLDTAVMSRYRGPCALHRAELDDDEFQQWYETHKAFCKLNHAKSSTSMEAAAALILWKQSESRLNLRYVNVICDGDSNTMKELREAKPYGEDVKLTKYECVGHVQKRLGKAVIDLRTKPPLETVQVTRPGVRARKATKNRPAVKASKRFTETVTKKVQVGGQGGLTKEKYLVLQQYYGNAIHLHAGDIDGMVEACWAVYYHSISTDDNPQHHCCLKGAMSWCFYQRAKKVAPPSIGTACQTNFRATCNRKDVLWVPHKIKMRASTVLFGSTLRRLTSLHQLQ